MPNGIKSFFGFGSGLPCGNSMNRAQGCLKDVMPFCLGALLAVMTVEQAGAQEAKLCHISNAGFYATDGESGVLMDALYADGLDGDPVASDALNQAMESASGEFSNVKLVFVSHFHEDHMKAKPILRHLRTNDQARAILPDQARHLTRAGAIEPAQENRVTYTAPTPGQQVTFDELPFSPVIYGLSHGEGMEDIESIGLKITIAGKTIMQVGDMYGEQPPLNDGEKIKLDYLILPFWYMSRPERVVYINRIFDAEHIIPMHFALDSSEWMQAQGGLAAVKARTFAATGNLIRLDEEMMCISLE